MIIDNIEMKYMIRIMIFIASLDITALQRLIIKLNSWNSGPPTSSHFIIVQELINTSPFLLVTQGSRFLLIRREVAEQGGGLNDIL